MSIAREQFRFQGRISDFKGEFQISKENFRFQRTFSISRKNFRCFEAVNGCAFGGGGEAMSAVNPA